MQALAWNHLVLLEASRSSSGCVDRSRGRLDEQSPRPLRPAQEADERRYAWRVSAANPYEELFARHRSATVPSLWGWQSEVLEAFTGVVAGRPSVAKSPTTIGSWEAATSSSYPGL
jgi:hypothetical protein